MGMIVCDKCNAQLGDDALFCESCGERVEKNSPDPQSQLFCHECGTAVEPGTVFCPNCGAKQGVEAPVANSAPSKAFGGGLSKKAMLAIAAVIVLVVAMVALPSLSWGKPAGGDGILYFKDDELVYTGLKKPEPFEVTDRFIDSGDSISNIIYNRYSIANFIYRTPDGSKLFYPDRTSSNANGITLYYRDLHSPKTEATKVDSDVRAYFVNDAANKIIYLKGSDGILYEHDLSEKTKIDSDVVAFCASSDGSKLIYINNDNTIYSKPAKKDKEKIDSDANIIHISDDLSRVYYIKNETLYLKKDGQDKEKIASDIQPYSTMVYDSGEVYFTKAEDVEVSMYEFVNDDLPGVSIAIPAEPQAPFFSDYSTLEEYYVAVEDYMAQSDAYREAKAQYDEQNARYELRDRLQNESTTTTNYTLYYYDGKSAAAVCDIAHSGGTNASSKPVGVFHRFTEDEPPSLRMSEITDIYQVYTMASTYNNSRSVEPYIVVGAEAFPLEAEDATYFQFNEASDKLYYINDYSYERGYGDLVEVSITAKGISDPVAIDDDVIEFFLVGEKEQSPVYYKDLSRNGGAVDMYFGGSLIDSDVYLYDIRQVGSTASLTYYVDWSESRSRGTLKLYDGKSTVKIADDVNDYYAVSEQYVAYLIDYNESRMRGELWLYSGKDQKAMLDDDVQVIMPFESAESNYRGYNYGW